MSSLDFESVEDLIDYLNLDYKVEPELIKIENSELEKIELTI